MTAAVAVPGDGRRVTRCCGPHHDASDCLCCAECTTNADRWLMSPPSRAALAHEQRERDALLRPSVRRARYALAWGDWEDGLRLLGRATHEAIEAAFVTSLPAVPENPWFTKEALS